MDRPYQTEVPFPKIFSLLNISLVPEKNYNYSNFL
jgi:hypothetical protein